MKFRISISIASERAKGYIRYLSLVLVQTKNLPRPKLIKFIFDMRTLHESLNQVMLDKNVHRDTLRMAKEGSKFAYRATQAQEEKTIMQDNGYQDEDDLSGKMFPTLYEN